mgnify:CR=1 FL=1
MLKPNITIWQQLHEQQHKKLPLNHLLSDDDDDFWNWNWPPFFSYVFYSRKKRKSLHKHHIQCIFGLCLSAKIQAGRNFDFFRPTGIQTLQMIYDDDDDVNSVYRSFFWGILPEADKIPNK